MGDHDKTRASGDAAHFNRQLLALADRLATHNIVVTRLHADWAAFGSWEVWTEAGAARDRYDSTILKGHRYYVPGPDVVRYCWDGRERFLSVAASTTPRLEGPEDWVYEPGRQFVDMDGALQFIEAHAMERHRGEA